VQPFGERAAILYVAAIIVQVFPAGPAIANLGGSRDFTAHIGVGNTIRSIGRPAFAGASDRGLA
jgi:hypothetical protein